MSAFAAALVLSAAQKYWLAVSYNIGSEYGSGLTISALAWQESSFCQHKRLRWSVGCLGTKRATVRKLFDPAATRSRLVSDNPYSIRAGLAIFLYCQTKTPKWRRQIACYHFGEFVEAQMSDAQVDADPYILSVTAKVKQLQAIPLDTE